MLKCLSKYLPRQTLDELYKLYVRPDLDYGDIIYHIPQSFCEFTNIANLSNQMEELESIQYSVALAATGAWQGTSREKLYEELGWESLNLRRWSRRLVMFYKVVNDMTPEYMKYPIPQFYESMYNLRKPVIIDQISVLYKSSFYPSSLSEWDKLDPEIKLSISVRVFKTEILSLILPTRKLVYSIFDPRGFSTLTQLRVGRSKLNSHKFRHNFKDTLNPMCPISDSIEDTEHILLLCDTYVMITCYLLDSVNAILQTNGLSNLSLQEMTKFSYLVMKGYQLMQMRKSYWRH